MRTRAPHSNPLDCSRLEFAPLGDVDGELIFEAFGMILLEIPEVVGATPDEVAEYIGGPFVMRRPSTPLSLAKPTEPVITPVGVVSYLGHVCVSNE
jgi:hypothetical protein